MIGPHEGKELELMLMGDKKLAIFHDAVPSEGQISEEIIPENAFAAHVQAGTIKRFSKDIYNTKSGNLIRYVCFTLPNEEWRASFILWLKEERLVGRVLHDPAHDAIIGRLLGYDEQDIEEFLAQAA